jgi:hypothetical protein
LLQALQIALDHDFHEHAARAYVNLGSAGTVNNDLIARRYLEQGLSYCEQRDLDSWSTYLRVFWPAFRLSAVPGTKPPNAPPHYCAKRSLPPLSGFPRS